MAHSRQGENIKICPQCGNSLMITAKRCVVCGYRFKDIDRDSIKAAADQHASQRLMPVTINLPILFGMIILFLAVGALFMLGKQKRDETKARVASEQATATYIATIYVSPTPSPTATRTPAPPTETPEVDIEYTVLPGDSCLSIAKRFNLYLDSILIKNNIDCGNLQIGTVLKIPHPTATPEAASTAVETPTP